MATVAFAQREASAVARRHNTMTLRAALALDAAVPLAAVEDTALRTARAAELARHAMAEALSLALVTLAAAYTALTAPPLLAVDNATLLLTGADPLHARIDLGLILHIRLLHARDHVGHLLVGHFLDDRDDFGSLLDGRGGHEGEQKGEEEDVLGHDGAVCAGGDRRSSVLVKGRL